ncbi:large-conductance mechanosensitive channel protein MscL [Ignatzschineria sp. LJL83]
MKFIQEFKEFAMRGNVIDLAVGVIIGGAFNKIVSSLVSDIIMPPLGVLLGGVDFKDFALTLKAAVGDEPAVILNYGMFIQNIFDFIIVAFSIFVAIRVMNKLREKQDEQVAEAVEEIIADPVPTKEEILLSEIRDILKNNQSKN